MKKKHFRPMTREERENKSKRSQALERESNITLASVAVVIVSLFLLLYISSAMKVNYEVAYQMIDVVSVLLVIGAIACAVVAIWKKKAFLWEYVVFALILAVLYYILRNGYAGFVGEEKIFTGEWTSFDQKASELLSNKNITYGLWGINILYGIYAIVFHSVKYRKIKKGNN